MKREVGESLFVSATLDSIRPGRGVGAEKVSFVSLELRASLSVKLILL